MQPIYNCAEELYKNHDIRIFAKTQATAEDYDQADVLLLSGLVLPEMIHQIKEWNKTKRIVWHTDDAWFDLDRWNPITQYVHYTELEVLRECLADAYRIVVTTPQLKDYYKMQDKTLVCPNLINMDEYPEYSPRDMNTVLYSAGHSHYADARLLEPVVDGTEKNWVFFGTLPEKCSQYVRRPGEGVQVKPAHFYGKRVGYIKPSQFGNYQSIMRSIPFGIGVAPLLDNQFNHNKSFLKMLEYAAFGCPTVASKVMPYADQMTDDIGYCVDDIVEEWVDAVEACTPEQGENAYNWVKKNWSWESEQKQLWLEMYKEIAA